MQASAVLLLQPNQIAVQRLDLTPAGDEDVVVDIAWSGISTGTERLLWSGRMPSFPGMGYPLVPGYEGVGQVVAAGARSGLQVGARVFVPGAQCFGPVRGLFGASASRVVVPGARVMQVDAALGPRAVLFALAATAQHALAAQAATLPDLIIGHGLLGRLLARLTLAAGGAPPTVWERNEIRHGGGAGYVVVHPDQDPRRDYRAIYDVSGDSTLLDTLIGRLAPGGEIVLAGFYADPLQFAFPAAFMREARLRIAAQWKPSDLLAARDLVASGALSLDGLLTHQRAANDAPAAYDVAFGDPACLKMILDWSACA